MNTYFALAAGLSALGGLLHSALGERLILSRLNAPDLPETLGSSGFTIQVLRLFWHLVTVAWWGLAALLLLHATMPPGDVNHQVVQTIAATFLASAAVSFVVSRGKHFSWGVLLIIAALVWRGGA